MPIIYWTILAVVLYIVFTRTTFGRQVIAVVPTNAPPSFRGQRPYHQAPHLCPDGPAGQHRRGHPDFAYRLDGIMPMPVAGMKWTAISAVIVGGTSMMGGKGSIVAPC
jgi:ABC-type xylose transport system permease subunit